MNALELAPPPPARSPWQRLYGALLARRRRRGARRAERLPVPVVSVGNLHWGGGGKTPFTIALARHLEGLGRRVAILSRGYRRTSRGTLVVSRGRGPEVDVAAAGDEPFLIATELSGVPVLVGERRAEAGRRALAELDPAPELFLLDDGFSHVSLVRDVELLLFPAADPFAGGRLLPSGRLREPLAASALASAVILTGAPAGSAGAGARLAAALSGFGFTGPGFASVTRAGMPTLDDGSPLAAGAPVIAACAVARPAEFFAAAEASGVRLLERRDFPDHHGYSAEDVARLDGLARRRGAEAVLVTAKDRAKLAGRLTTPLALLPIEARPETAFWSWFDARLVEVSEREPATGELAADELAE